MRMVRLLTAVILAPSLALAQVPPAPAPGQAAAIERLNEVLPPDIAADVIQIVTDATNRGLPGQAVALRALEGVAKTRSGEAAREAARALVETLAASRDALQAGGRSGDDSEIVAGATAMELGVSGAAVSELAKSAPSGRSLAVPLAVLGALVGRDLPADNALAAVRERLAARVSDAQLVEMPGEAGRLLAEGMKPSEVGLTLASGKAGFAVPPYGAPSGVPTNTGRSGDRPQPPTPPRP